MNDIIEMLQAKLSQTMLFFFLMIFSHRKHMCDAALQLFFLKNNVGGHQYSNIQSNNIID